MRTPTKIVGLQRIQDWNNEQHLRTYMYRSLVLGKRWEVFCDGLPGYSSLGTVVQKSSLPKNKYIVIQIGKEQAGTRASAESRQVVFDVSYGIIIACGVIFPNAQTFGQTMRMRKSYNW